MLPTYQDGAGASADAAGSAGAPAAPAAAGSAGSAGAVRVWPSIHVAIQIEPTPTLLAPQRLLPCPVIIVGTANPTAKQMSRCESKILQYETSAAADPRLREVLDAADAEDKADLFKICKPMVFGALHLNFHSPPVQIRSKRLTRSPTKSLSSGEASGARFCGPWARIHRMQPNGARGCISPAWPR